MLLRKHRTCFGGAKKIEFYNKRHVRNIFADILSLDGRDKFSRNSILGQKPRIMFHVAGDSNTRKLDKKTVYEVCLLLPEYDFIIVGGVTDKILYPKSFFTLENVSCIVGHKAIDQYQKIMQEVDMIIGPDSMFIHFADRNNLPSVAIMGPAPVKMWGPRHPDSISLSVNPPCSPCTKENCDIYNGNSCVQSITSIQISDACKRIIKQKGV